MESKSLNTMLISYKNNIMPKKKIIEAISLFVYKFPLKKYRWLEDDCSEFFSYFFPKIGKIIDSFIITDVPFEAYLIKTLKLQIKTFALKKIADNINRKILEHKEFWSFNNREAYCAESNIDFNKQDFQPSYFFIKKLFLDNKTRHGCSNKTLKKRILLLLLKNMNNISETEIPAIAEILNCDKEWFHEAFSKINQKIEKKIKRKKLLEERRNRHFCRLYHLHELSSNCNIIEEKNKYLLAIIKTKSYINKITEKINTFSVGAAHKDIAEVMNIPKGSVDSGLFYFKLYVEDILENK